MGLNVDIRIDELVLHGYPAASRERIADALQAELTRLVLRDRRSAAARGETATGIFAATPRAPGAPGGFERESVTSHIRLAHNATPERTGRAIARTLHDSMRAAPSPAHNQPRGGGR